MQKTTQHVLKVDLDHWINKWTYNQLRSVHSMAITGTEGVNVTQGRKELFFLLTVPTTLGNLN